MRLLLVSLLVAFFAFNSYAQKFQVKWGPEYKKEGGLFSADYLLGSDDKYFYALSNPGPKANLQKFDFTCKLISAAPINLDLGKGKTSVTDMLRAGARTYLMLRNRDKKADVMTYFNTELKNGKFNTAIKNFYAMPLDYVMLSDNFKVSENGEYIAALATSKGKNKEEVLKAVVFDNSFKIIWESTFPLKISDRNIYIEQYIVDNKGTIYVSGKQYDSGEAFKKGLPKYKFTVFKLNQGDKTETVVTLDGDKAPWDSGLFPSPDGGVYVGGFYTKTTTSKGSADGVFIAEVANGKSKANAYAFTEEFLEGLQTKKQDKKDEGITSFNIDYLVKLPDGSLSFIAEKYFVTVHTYSNGKTTTTYYVYHSNEIVVPRFSPEGKLVSMDKVDKVFSSRSPMVVSYSFFIKDNSIVLVYNDFKTRDERKSSGKGRAIYTDISYIPGNGSVKTENIFTSKDVEKYYIPSASLDLGNGKHIVKAIKGKTYVYGIITL